MRRIPAKYDFVQEGLSPTELHARSLGLNIENWQKFRYRINTGTNTTMMHWTGAPNRDVEESYLELGKSHHEVICSLTYMKMCLDQAVEADPVELKRNVKQFYFHAGCLLDNLARLIFIMCDRNSHAATRSIGYSAPIQGGRATKTTTPVRKRHYIDWGSLRGCWNNSDYVDYKYWLIKGHLDEIINVRNCLTHSWQPPMILSEGVNEWPCAIRTKRDFLWPYDITEASRLKREYKKWGSIRTMMQTDMSYLENMQSRVFRTLPKSFQAYETRQSFTIQ